MAKKLSGLNALIDSIAPVSGESSLVKRVPLDQVQPDPDQPRRVLPPDLAETFRQTGRAAEALAAWAQRTDPLAVEAYAELDSLARSLESDGLINPVTVQARGAGYQIISGERRWWAHHLLAQQGRFPKNGQPGQIEILVHRAGDVSATLQLVENLLRQDLCAVEVALGLAELIARLEGSPLSTVVDNSAGGGEKLYTTVYNSTDGGQKSPMGDNFPGEGGQLYTTVYNPADGPAGQKSPTVYNLADTASPKSPVGDNSAGGGEKLYTTVYNPAERLVAVKRLAARRLKAGTWEQVEAHLGRSRQHWQHYLALLRLSDEALRLAWEHRLTERALRPAVAESDPARQIALVKHLAQRQLLDLTDAEPETGTSGGAKTPAPLPFSRRLVRQLRGFEQALAAKGDARATPAKVAKELAQSDDFEQVAHTAKRLQPYLEAILKAASEK